MNTTLSAPDKVLLAAAALTAELLPVFTREQLVVKAWTKFPESFGLRGFEETFPDSTKVYSLIMGERSLVARGLMTKSGSEYGISQKGRAEIEWLREETPPKPALKPARSKPSAKQDHVLRAMFGSPRLADPVKAWSFTDACRFWAMEKANDFGPSVNSRLDYAEAMLAGVLSLIGDGHWILGDGRHVAPGEITELLDIHEALKRKFAGHLEILRHKAPETNGRATRPWK